MYMDSVVKVFCTHTEPNFSLPWQKKRQHSSTSSGFVIEGRRVLTNAHSVHNYTRVKVRKRGLDTKFVATVLAIGTECDIAMLTIEDDKFWEGVSPIEFGSLPALQEAVTVVGYPMGGDTTSITSGIVSRVETLEYSRGHSELLGLQIDAAINLGNSGGPAFNAKGECVGIAFRGLNKKGAENIGYVIPTQVVKHFIQDYDKFGKYTGFPSLGIKWQTMENPYLRKAMAMTPEQKGIRVKRVEPTASTFHFLKPSDVILSIDGIDIANDGTIPFRNGERINFDYLVNEKYIGENVVFKVLRDAKVLEFDIRLDSYNWLVPTHIQEKSPSYYIVAGFVFTVLSVPYFCSESDEDFQDDAPVRLLDKIMNGMAESSDEQLVILSQVLEAEVNIGYEKYCNDQVLAFNDKPFKNLKNLVDMVESCDDEFLKFDLDSHSVLILETSTAKAATSSILATHNIPSAMSDDLKS